MTHLGSMLQLPQVKLFSELVGCLLFVTCKISTEDHNVDTDSSLESFISFGNLCKLTPLGLVTDHCSYNVQKSSPLPS